jgi:hypothetical protein
MFRHLLMSGICLAFTATPLFSQTSDTSGPALVRGWYRQYFHREPEPRSVAVWSYLFRLGNSREAVLTKMLSTDEYYRRAGQTPDGLVRALFDDGASSTASLDARDAWLQRVRNLDRTSIATEFLRAHPEALRPATVASPLLVAQPQRTSAIADARSPFAPITSKRRSNR